MKSMLAKLCNGNTLIVEFDFTGKDLKLAATLDSDPLVIRETIEGREGLHEAFRLSNSSSSCLSKSGASFPFKCKAASKVTVSFPVAGSDEETINFGAAQAVARLEVIETQVIEAVNAMRQTANTITSFEFPADAPAPAEEGADE